MPSVANLSLPGTALPGAVTVTIADGDSLKKQIAQYVATIAKACTKDRFVVALSGGSMPKLLTGLLDLDVDWSKWDVFFADFAKDGYQAKGYFGFVDECGDYSPWGHTWAVGTRAELDAAGWAEEAFPNEDVADY